MAVPARKDPVEWKNRQQPRVLGLTASYLNGRRLGCPFQGSPVSCSFPSAQGDYQIESMVIYNLLQNMSSVILAQW